jgi:hypothetical protein
MHWQQGGEKRWRKVALHPWNLSQEPRGSLCTSFAFLAFAGVVCCVKSAWPVLETGLTDFGNRSDRFWEPAWPVCAQSWHLFRGSLHLCMGSSCILWWFVLFAWAWFCLGCVEPLPLPKGSETCLLQVILFFAFLGFWSLVGVSFYSFLFFFLFSDYQMCVVNALIKGEIEEHVWFEDRWMVASWCDEWLTTLCGQILG